MALTSDGRPVVFHDDQLDRTSDGTGLLAATPFEILKHLDAGSWFAPAFAGELIPTLEEVLETLATLGLGFNMEIKPDRGREVETAHIALAITARTGRRSRATAADLELFPHRRRGRPGRTAAMAAQPAVRPPANGLARDRPGR